jgi:hypothetical protein
MPQRGRIADRFKNQPAEQLVTMAPAGRPFATFPNNPPY